MDIQIRKMTPALVEDYFKFFDEIAFADHPEWGCGCYCCFYHAPSAKEWEARTGAQNKAQAREMILADQLTGLLAYVDGLPVAWCHYAQKDRLPGIAVFYPEFISKSGPEFLSENDANNELGEPQTTAASADTTAPSSGDAKTGKSAASGSDTSSGSSIAAIVCFTVAQGYRQQGIAGQMIDFACHELAEAGMAIVEAYPMTASGSDEHNYHGPLSMYLSHGFTVYRELEGNTIVRKVL